jgi:hypothetical protein
MNEEMLRAMIREAVARRLAQAPDAAMPAPAAVLFMTDPSHDRYPLPASGGPCLIEPAVSCNHCGYCESHGH